MKAPGDQLIQSGNTYDTASGAAHFGQRLRQYGSGGFLLPSSTKRRTTTRKSQPTILGIQFDVSCSAFGVDYSGTVALNLQPSTPGQGYYIYGDDGSLLGYHNDHFLNYLGDLTTVPLNNPIVGMATTTAASTTNTDSGGYWMVATDGGIFAFGDAKFFGSTGAIHLNKPIVGMAATPDGKRLLVGGNPTAESFSFGDALVLWIDRGALAQQADCRHGSHARPARAIGWLRPMAESSPSVMPCSAARPARSL